MATSREVLRFDLPATAAVANLTGPATGIQRLVARPPRESTATVIDTADHRLLDWGVELYRIAETGQWTLKTPGWEPTLPAEQTSPEAEDEIPAEMADVLVPFRRGGILGPKLRVVTLRRRFSLLDAEGRSRGELSDERVQVFNHSGELASYRNVTLRAEHPSADQLQALTAAFIGAGGSVVDSFDTLATRLGLTHHVQRRSALSARVPIEEFVGAQFESRWRRLLRDDLTVRTSGSDDADLRAGITAFRNELAGLEPLLRDDWVQAGTQLLAAALADDRPLQHSQRWPRILDLLAHASTQPPLRQIAGRITGPVLAQELEAVVQTLRDQCRTLDPYSDDARWVRADQVAGRALALSTLARDVFGKPAKQLRKNLETIAGALRSTVRAEVAGGGRDLHGLTTAEVFQAGRAYERAMLSVDYAREQFVREWPLMWDRLRVRVIRPRVPHAVASGEGEE